MSGFLNGKRPKPTPTPIDPGVAELAQAKRQLAESQALLEAERSAKAKAEDAARAAQAARDEQVLTHWLNAEASKHKAKNAAHVSKLIGDSFVVVDGVVKLKSDPAKSPEDHVKAWFEGDGKVYVEPAITPGAGASRNAGPGSQPPPLDLSTSEGMTQWARGL